MNVITSVTVWNDAIGKRLSASYSVVDGNTGKIISDNNRFDRVVTDAAIKTKIDELMEYAAQSMED